MKKYLLFAFFAFALCVFCACSQSDDGMLETVPTEVGGEGESLFLMPEDESAIKEIVIRNLDIDVADGGRYEIVIGSHRKVSCDIKCDSEMYSEHGLAIEYKGKQMIVSADPGKEYQLDSFRMMIYGTYEKITLENCDIDLSIKATDWNKLTLEMTGESSCDVTELDTQIFDVKLSGNSELSVSGVAITANVAMSGESKFNSKELVCGTVSFNMSGDSDAVVTSSTKLDVKASGESSLVYYGDPKVTDKLSGNASVTKGE